MSTGIFAAYNQIRAACNVVVINKESDFDSQTLTTITFKKNRHYYFGSLVHTDKSIVIEDGVLITGLGMFNLVLVYTGVGTMFTSVTASWEMENFRFDCPSGTIFNKSGVGTILLTKVVGVTCAHFGNFSSGGQGVPNGFQVAIAVFAIKQTGVVLSGEFSLIALREVFLIALNPGTVLLDWFDATIPNFELNNVEFRGPVGAFALRAGAGGVNISPGSLGTIQNSSLGLPGTLTPLAGGLDPDDAAYLYQNTLGVIDSRVIGHTYVVTPVETDVISDVPVRIAGIFAHGSTSSQSASDADGIITVLNRIEQHGETSVNIDLTKQSGSAKEYFICIQKDAGGLGVLEPVEGGCTTVTLAGGGSVPVALSAPTRFIENDKYLVTITGLSTGEDITAFTQNFKVIG